jgi:hypothetical protein
MEPAKPGIFEIVCTSGARGKCVRLGYLPWVSAAMRDIYYACVRLVRADYCGDGEATTRDGMRIDLYDDRDVQQSDRDPLQEFEGGLDRRRRGLRASRTGQREYLARKIGRFLPAIARSSRRDLHGATRAEPKR